MIEQWLAAVEYVPGWRFTLHDHDEAPVLSIEFSVPDSRQPGEIQDQRVWTFVPPCETADDFYRWLHWRLMRIAVHEVNEFFRVDGSVWRDPHQSMEEQVS